MTGDLSRKKLMPAVYDLANRGLLPPGFALVGFARRDWADQDFAQIVHDSVKEHARTPFREEVWQQLAEGIRFVAGRLRRRRGVRAAARDDRRAGRRPAAPAATTPSTSPSRPKFFPDVVQQLKEHGLAEGTGRRLAPGRHREAVRPRPGQRPGAEPRSSTRCSRPASVFRIDHYLGKETVQNILALRFANTLFEPIWNANYVDHVQITMAEDIGIGGRAGYYDGIGAARDVIQNHLLQLLALTAMEEPVSFDADGAGRPRSSRCSRRCGCPKDLGTHTVRGQYAAGWQGGEKVHRLPRGGRHRPQVEDRHLRRDQAGDRQPPLGGRAVLPAYRQAARPPGHRDRGRLQARPAPALRRHRRPRSSGRTPWSSGSSRTRA